jgi:hypothetical protein
MSKMLMRQTDLMLRTAFAALVVAALACSDGPFGSSEDRREVRGTIVNVRPTPQSSYSVVEVIVADLDSASKVAAGGDSVGLYVLRGTEIYLTNARGARTRGTTRNLLVGATLEAAHTGHEDRTRPVRLTATRIAIVRATP